MIVLCCLGILFFVGLALICSPWRTMVIDNWHLFKESFKLRQRVTDVFCLSLETLEYRNKHGLVQEFGNEFFLRWAESCEILSQINVIYPSVWDIHTKRLNSLTAGQINYPTYHKAISIIEQEMSQTLHLMQKSVSSKK